MILSVVMVYTFYQLLGICKIVQIMPSESMIPIGWMWSKSTRDMCPLLAINNKGFSVLWLKPWSRERRPERWPCACGHRAPHSLLWYRGRPTHRCRGQDLADRWLPGDDRGLKSGWTLEGGRSVGKCKYNLLKTVNMWIFIKVDHLMSNITYLQLKQELILTIIA